MFAKAVILSAGQGRRLLPLTQERPKCLLPFGGRSLLDWQMDCLAGHGVRDITVVTGFRAEAIDSAVRARSHDGLRIRTLFNPFFAVADNVGSCFLAREHMRGEAFILLNGDTLFHPRLLARAMEQARGPITLTIDHKDRYDADDMKVLYEGDRLLRIGKDLAEANGESIGMMFFSAEGGAAFAAGVEASLHDPEGLKRWYLSVVDQLARKGWVGVAAIQGEEWCEVDYPKDLADAERLTARIRRSWTDEIVPASTRIGRAM